MRAFPAYFYVFDILYFDKYDLRSCPLICRKKMLKVVLWNKQTVWTPFHEGRRAFFAGFRKAAKELSQRQKTADISPLGAQIG